MSIVEERPPASGSARPPVPRTPADAPDRPPRPQPTGPAVSTGPTGPTGPPAPTGPASPAGRSASTALAMASIRISRGNPTSEETAAVAALLVACLRRLHETGPSTEPRARRLPHRPGPAYRAPGSWAS